MSPTITTAVTTTFGETAPRQAGSSKVLLALYFLQAGCHSVTQTNKCNEKSARRRCKHCALAVVRRSQKFCSAADPLPGGAGRKKIPPLPTTPVWWGSMHAISSYRGNRPTHTHTPTNRQDQLQYTVPQLACSVKILNKKLRANGPHHHKKFIAMYIQLQWSLPYGDSDEPSTSPLRISSLPTSLSPTSRNFSKKSYGFDCRGKVAVEPGRGGVNAVAISYRLATPCRGSSNLSTVHICEWI